MRHRKIIFPIIILICLIFTGSFIYHYIEGLGYLDSVYFTVITMTTIGYGDFSPQTNAGKIFTIMFSFIGITMAFYFFSLVAKFVFTRRGVEKMNKVKLKK